MKGDFCRKDPKDWVTDYSQENGMYQNRCIICKETFFGHKHRTVCKTCAEVAANRFNGYKEAEKIDNIFNHLLKTYPIVDNLYEWRKLTRTIETSISLLKDLISKEDSHGTSISSTSSE